MKISILNFILKIREEKKEIWRGNLQIERNLEIHQPIIICEPYLEPDSNKETVKKTKIDDIYEN